MKTLLLLLAFIPLGVQATTIYETYPGSNTRNWGQPAVRVQEGQNGVNIYQTLPGSNTRDYRQPGTVIQNGTIYRTLPGSNTRDWSKPGVRWEDD